jgi:hypothetical protein
MSFPFPATEHIAVDVVGYYVAPGTPVLPQLLRADADDSAAKTDPSARHRVQTSIVHSGDAGDIYLDGGYWNGAGVYMRALPASPSIVAHLGNSNGASAFYVSNPNGAFMSMRSDGAIWLNPTTFIDGRTDFFGTPGSYPGYVAIPTNTVHDVRLVNPRDASNGSATRVVFFNASTDDEYTSPPVTKFSARTGGYYAQENVNYESIIHWHMPNQFHFRAVSSSENKNTFWVKAATSQDSVTQTRADMFVSGRTGIGVQNPSASLHVEDLTNDVEFILSAGDNPGVANYPTLTLMRKDGNDAQIAKYGWRLDSDDSNKLKLLYGTNGGFGATPLMTVDTAGTVTARVIGALYQDVAEWVPAAVDMEPGTVVVLNSAKANEVLPSAVEYDSRVAGVVSARPGLILGEAGVSKEMIATTGRVRVRVDARRNPIAIGDLLVTSGHSGAAMKSIPLDLAGTPIHRPGTIIGKALEPLASGEGEILVLLSLQ